MTKRFILLLPLLLFVFLIEGCWSNYELEDRALVSGLGIDLGQNDHLLVTTQIIIPMFTHTRGGVTGSAVKEPAVEVFSAEANTVAEAVNKISKLCGRELFFPHLDILIVGEELARAGVEPVVDWVNRDREMRLQTWFAVVNGTAEEALKVQKVGLESIPIVYVSRSLEVSMRENTRGLPVRFLDYFSSLTENVDPVISKIEISKAGGEKTVLTSGGSVFKGFKLVGWLTDTEARGYLWLTERFRRGNISVSLPGNGFISAELRGNRIKRKVEFVDGEPVILVDIAVKTNLDQVSDPLLTLEKPEDLEALESPIEEKIATEVRAAVEKARNLDADIFGFGQLIRRQYPNQWKDMKNEWDLIFPTVPVDVKVKVIMRRTEQISSPARPVNN